MLILSNPLFQFIYLAILSNNYLIDSNDIIIQIIRVGVCYTEKLYRYILLNYNKWHDQTHIKEIQKHRYLALNKSKTPLLKYDTSNVGKGGL